MPQRTVSALAKRSDDQKRIAAMYNAHSTGGVHGRKKSIIFQLRKLNNWVKSTLINEYVDRCPKPRDATILDFAGGKGGDLGKFAHRGGIREYCLADHAEDSVKEAQRRYNNMRNKDRQRKFNFPVTWVVGDLFNCRFSEALPASLWFDVASCQFAFHYAFESEARLRAGLTNICDRLKPGGWFIGTTLDSNVLIRKWRACKPGVHQYGNRVYTVRVCTDDRRHPEIEQKKLNPAEPFGIRYYFMLEDAVEECPEYIVHFPTFKRIAAEYGLELVLEQNFHEYFVRNFEKPKNLRSLHTMRVLGDNGQFPADQWDVAYLYKTFAFRKSTKGQDGRIPRRDNMPQPRTYDESHIIRLQSAAPSEAEDDGGGAMEDDEDVFDDEDYDIDVDET